MAAAPPVVNAYRALRRARAACRSTTRSIPTPTTRSTAEPRFACRPRLSRQPPARPRGAGRGVLPRARGACCPSAASCSAATAGTTRRCRRTSRISAMSTRTSTTRSTARRWRCSTSPATAWPTSASRRRPACSRRRAPRACLITDAWEGIELFLEPDEEVLVARDGAGRRRASSRALTPERARAIGEAALPARARRAHLRAPRRRGRRAAATRHGEPHWKRRAA